MSTQKYTPLPSKPEFSLSLSLAPSPCPSFRLDSCLRSETAGRSRRTTCAPTCNRSCRRPCRSTTAKSTHTSTSQRTGVVRKFEFPLLNPSSLSLSLSLPRPERRTLKKNKDEVSQSRRRRRRRRPLRARTRATIRSSKLADRNPKDYVLFSAKTFKASGSTLDNTGKREYKDAPFPTLTFPSDHGILRTTLTFN